MATRAFERLIRVLTEIGGSRPSEERATRRRLLHFAIGASLVAAAIVGTIIGLVVAVGHLLTDPLNDVPTFYVAAQRLNAGETIYPAGADPDQIPYYRYPPLLAIVLRPFALLPYPVFAALWEAGTILAFALLVRRLGVNRRTAIALGILGVQIGGALPIGQSQVHVTWLLAVGQPWAIALVGQVKVFPALVALYWIGRGDYRQFVRFVSWSIALIVFQFVLAPAETIAFVQTLSLNQVGLAENLSPYGFSRPLWFGLALAFLVITPLVARTRFGWATAIAYSTLVSPRLFLYHLLSFSAALRKPDEAKAAAPKAA
jgi:hypothetical protein